MALFTDVLRLLVHPTNYHCEIFTKSTRVKPTKRSYEVLHVCYDTGHGFGHFCGAVKDGDTVHFFDSMGPESEYTHRFVWYLRKRYGRDIRAIQEYKDVCFQNRDVGDYTLRGVGPTAHQYCYLEALLYLFHKVYGESMGVPSKGRVRFLKSKRDEWLNRVHDRRDDVNQ